MRPTPDPRTRARATTLLAAAAAAVAARGVFRVCRSRPPGGSARWTRTNHRGEQVSLLLGPAAVAAAAATTAVAPGLDRGERLAGMVAVLGSGAVGLYDDLAGTTTVKGFRGHLRALRRGEVTSGLVKIAGIGASGVLAAAALREGSRAQRTDGARSASGPTALVDTLADGALIAMAANVVNLFDLRPGRALKVVLAHTPALLAAAGPALAAPVGAAAGLVADDLGERGMLGDCGANALGAGIGVAIAARAPRPLRWAALAGLVGLTLAAERVSFTAVIEAHPPLRRLDELGRRKPSR
ncbi:hypothetical protein [Actinopolymorpha pittospori]|uniref:UDP-N-acetylmuramyl pentapeptide phosphotransferase/UDP-N-acetylglucosamine-1-phosphate transferase n=1 Tax=Actinopolymorpha pittospori TaxID=648752 RepID=A0A927MZ18_9ACTN|nr:hypothetical protein [Actinopolymorpha pittospori]MBE1609590.1 hypothetical protein [Actinopolymorpha pittospori]